MTQVAYFEGRVHPKGGTATFTGKEVNDYGFSSPDRGEYRKGSFERVLRDLLNREQAPYLDVEIKITYNIPHATIVRRLQEMRKRA